MIWDVTRAYTSRFSVAVFSFVDIVSSSKAFGCLGIVPERQSDAVPFRPNVRFG